MILALDLGVTTGYAVLMSYVHGLEFDYDLVVEEHGTISDDVFGLVLPQILQDNGPDLKVVMEEPLLLFRGPLRRQLESVVTVANALCPRAAKLTPSEWKDGPFGKQPLPRGLSTHERDAIRLGLHYRASLA